MMILELLSTLLAVILVFAIPNVARNFFALVEERLARVAKHRRLSVLLTAGAVLSLRAALLPIFPIPVPAGHDEFSYLLAADTFAHGRVSNPPHPMWTHFESFHVNQKPTYVSMYYPAQGLFLAVGQCFFGHPFWGVWLSTGLMCGAICWMLQGWFPPVWALVGGLVAAMRLGVFSYWMNSYSGGSVAALGGALVLGALPRIKQEPRIRNTVLMCIGFAILANSRPYEGIFVFVPVAVSLFLWINGTQAPNPWLLVKRVVLPGTLFFLLTVGGMGYYFYRTTTSPFTTPYTVNSDTYRPVGLFPWQHANKTPVYLHAVMRDYYTGWVVQQFDFARSHPLILLMLKGFVLWAFFLGPVLTIPFFAACFVLPYGISLRDLRTSTRFLLIVMDSVLFAIALPVCAEPHYLAPVTCVVYALLLIAMKAIRHWKPGGRPVGVALVRVVPLLAVVLLLFPICLPALRFQSTIPQLMTWCSSDPAHTARQAFQHQLSQGPDEHLVIVHYLPDHDVRDEWVYNGADIDHSKVVWARDMGPEKNLELIRYFSDRKVWLVEPDEAPPRLLPYTFPRTAEFIGHDTGRSINVSR